MKKMILALVAMAFVAPAHAISLVSLHMGAGACSVMVSTGSVSWVILFAGLAALGLVIGIRVLRRYARTEQS
ncbi:MAG: hypothetical protein LJE84_05530 [Gammaproteobacteria bacterium]|nr:hypothetical protein [Gammaproteobacteria bacterium]